MFNQVCRQIYQLLKYPISFITYIIQNIRTIHVFDVQNIDTFFYNFGQT